VALFKQFPERYFAAAPIGLMGLDEESIALTGEGLKAPTDALVDLLDIEEDNITIRDAVESVPGLMDYVNSNEYNPYYENILNMSPEQLKALVAQ